MHYGRNACTYILRSVETNIILIYTYIIITEKVCLLLYNQSHILYKINFKKGGGALIFAMLNMMESWILKNVKGIKIAT